MKVDIPEGDIGGRLFVQIENDRLGRVNAFDVVPTGV